MFRWFRVLLASLQELVVVTAGLGAAVLQHAVELSERAAADSNGDLSERVEQLERTRALWEAEMQGLVLKADSAAQSAKNAEARANTTLRNAKKLGYGSDEDGVGSEEELRERAEQLGILPAEHAEGSDPTGVHLVRPPLEDEPAKAPAMRAKFGG